jgi:hypothetical protein
MGWARALRLRSLPMRSESARLLEKTQVPVVLDHPGVVAPEGGVWIRHDPHRLARAILDESAR